jgi:transcriptional regulator GlxA family with amidase domain
MEICVLLARSLSAEGRGDPSPEEARRFVIEKVKSFIITNAGRPLTLDEIAWQAGWSGAHLARVFRHATGESVFGYLNRVRVNQAKNLLVSTALPVGEVARSTGFSSPAVFARSFQKAIGTTARSYRHSQRPGWVPEERVKHGVNHFPGTVEELPQRKLFHNA